MTARAGDRWSDPVLYNDLAARFQRHNAEILADRIARDLPVGGRAIDLGCGTGFLAAAVRRRRADADMTCVDISRAMLNAARGDPDLAGCTFIEASMVDVVPDGEPFDAVVSNAALHWAFPDHAAVFDRVASLVRPGGIIAFATAGRNAAALAFDARVRRVAKQVSATLDPIEFSARRISPEDAAASMRNAGLAVDDAVLIERGVAMTIAEYADWLVASGGPWQAFSSDSRALRSAAEAAFETADGVLAVGHWSTIVFGRKP